ncbi:MAG: hypothetical protein ACREQ5_23720, partial [Candidatus Dormibacteria bacterium]
VEVIRGRLVEHQVKTAPVLDHYRALGTPVVNLDGRGPVEVVRRRIHLEVAWALDGGQVELLGSAAGVAPAASTV